MTRPAGCSDSMLLIEEKHTETLVDLCFAVEKVLCQFPLSIILIEPLMIP